MNKNNLTKLDLAKNLKATNRIRNPENPHFKNLKPYRFPEIPSFGRKHRQYSC